MVEIYAACQIYRCYSLAYSLAYTSADCLSRVS